MYFTHSIIISINYNQFHLYNTIILALYVQIEAARAAQTYPNYVILCGYI